jgi:hypothetical protein
VTSRTDVLESKVSLVASGLAEEADRLAAAPLKRGGACNPRTTAFAALSRAELSRLHRSDADLWDAVADRWQEALEP